MGYGIIEPEAFTSMMALLKITSAEEAEGKFEDTPLQTAFEVEVLSYEEQDEDDAARIGHKFQDWASFKKDTRTGGIGIAYGGKLWNLIAATLGEECARPTGGSHGLTTGDSTQCGEGAKLRAAPDRSKGAAKGIIEAGVLHLPRCSERCSEGALPFARIATTKLHERLPWVTTSLYPTASEREECMLSMLFWVLAALAVVGALAIVWGMYLLVHRWL